MEIESYEDDVLLPLPDLPPSPAIHPKLRRLKKKSAPADAPPVPVPTPVVPNSTAPVDDAGSPMIGEKSTSDDADLDLDPLFSAPVFPPDSHPQDLDSEEKDAMDLDAGGKVPDDGSGKKKSAKKRLTMDATAAEPEPSNNKKKKKTKPAQPKESVREKKRLEKERKTRLDQVHAETQRLLRETRDASFKPVPLVQKPISSVLEKIRLRKLQVLKQFNMLHQSDSVSDMDSPGDEVSPNAVLTESQRDTNDDDSARVDVDVHAADAGSREPLPDPCGAAACVEAVCNGSKLNVTDNNPGDTHYDTSEDILIPSLSASNSKPDPADLSSSEEDNDKENNDPHPYRAVDMGLYPKGGPAKVFVDDEAEEEDDSDHDLTRFQENEDESDDDEEFNDLIATGFEEAHVDHEKRNELHQKWLEQQDSAATDNVLQRLKSSKKKREPALPFEEDIEEFDQDSEEEASYASPPSNAVQKNSKKAKQMITEMFNDGNDMYVPSDDEETEQTLIRQRFLKQTEETSFISPLNDDNSREVFGLIKKLNIAPNSKKRGKTTSSFDTLMMGGSSNSSSKSSFLGRVTSSSLSSSHKQGSSAVRAFIFGRDDSNSRSNISTSEDVPNTGHKDNQPVKAASTKLISSQLKLSSKTKNEADSGPSLFDILLQSSMQFDKQTETTSGSKTNITTETEMAFQMSAFKLGKRFSKAESRI